MISGRYRAAPIDAIDSFIATSAYEITAEKVINPEDAYLEGHYPDFTIYPGVFSIESVQQAVEKLVGQTWDSPITVELIAIKSVRFTAPLLPGDTLRVHCHCEYLDGDLLRVKAKGRNHRDEPSSSMNLDFALVKVDQDV